MGRVSGSPCQQHRPQRRRVPFDGFGGVSGIQKIAEGFEGHPGGAALLGWGSGGGVDAVDPAEATTRQPMLEDFDAGDRRQLWAPAGFARGFCALSEWVEVQYLCTGTYNGACEGGIRWDDPALGIPWPTDEPLVSEKDAKAPTLAKWLDNPESATFPFR